MLYQWVTALPKLTIMRNFDPCLKHQPARYCTGLTFLTNHPGFPYPLLSGILQSLWETNICNSKCDFWKRNADIYCVPSVSPVKICDAYKDTWCWVHGQCCKSQISDEMLRLKNPHEKEQVWSKLPPSLLFRECYASLLWPHERNSGMNRTQRGKGRLYKRNPAWECNQEAEEGSQGWTSWLLPNMQQGLHCLNDKGLFPTPQPSCQTISI